MTAVPLADVTADTIAALYVPGAPSAGGANADAAATGPGGATPAEASGTDLPVPDLGNVGPAGGAGGGFGSIGPLGGGGSTVYGLPGGGSGGGSGGGGTGGFGGGGSGGGGGVTPPTVTPPSVGGVPEPSTWALMLIGVGSIGGLARREKRRHPIGRTA